MMDQAAAGSPSLTRKLGRPRILIVGCGDVGQRCLAVLQSRFRVLAVTSREAGRAPLQAAKMKTKKIKLRKKKIRRLSNQNK